MRVHTLEQLELAAQPGKRLVVLGDPISHSLSPAMHNAALARMALDFPELQAWQYEAIHVPAIDLPKALEVLHAHQVMGINLTIPHKVDVLTIIEEIDDLALAMGAVNTLKWTPSGYAGTNTDGYGIRKAVEEAFACELSGQDVWLFGAGGAARGIAVSCLQSGCRRLTVVNRSEPRLRELENQFVRNKLDGLERTRFCLLAEAPSDQAEAGLLINATSLGLKETDRNPIGRQFLKPGFRVYDTTYGTINSLSRDCLKRGIPYADGLSMLVWQGALSLEIWTGKDVPAGAMRQAAELSLKERLLNG